ncbi:hypothetical protein [Anaerovorax odorimutans]|nr:hypothetical protein [Anaerovorax odorimutans]
MRMYYVRFLKRMLNIRGKEYIDTLLNLEVITQEEYNNIFE